MPKNILIFSDGTGQAGGIAFDEDRTNIYKMYRATRCGPDSTIHPNEQVAFYDPGLGSPADGGFMFGKTGRWLYNVVSQATGLGITANIIDCYAALIRLYRDGDKIFLFGFSRGAYTVRCLAGVLAFCGIPRELPGRHPLPLDVKHSRKLANDAVRSVYQFCSSHKRTSGPSYRNFMLDTRNLVAKRFRIDHGCSIINNGDEISNVFPYFIGVYDTVAALGNTLVAIGIIGLLVLVSLLLSFGLSWLFRFLLVNGVDVSFIGNASPWLLGYFSPLHIFTYILILGATVGLIAYLRNYLKFDFRVPGYNWLWKFATIHFAYPKQKFYDTTLNANVIYAKHAVSIDENRKDFTRVHWSPIKEKENKRDSEGNLYFEQVWFPGVHADIGGGYPENESRLSDITLYWMLAAASIVPNSLKYDESVLNTFGDPTGPQHDECKARSVWLKRERDIPKPQAPMHRSVYQRFQAPKVVQYDIEAPYRPSNMSTQSDFVQYYTGAPNPKPTQNPQGECDNIEYKWEQKKKM